MKRCVLVDNQAVIDRYLLAEPALAVLVEHGGTRVLFDAGYSEVLTRNARALGEDLGRLDWVALSHGHQDHTWGLHALIRAQGDAAARTGRLPRPRLVAHPGVFDSRSADGLPEIGALLTWDKAARHFEPVPEAGPRELAPGLFFLGEVPRVLDFEPPVALGRREDGIPDLVPDDTALACVTRRGLVVLTGCAHAGVCNTVLHALAVTGRRRVRAVVGGMHLLGAPAARLEATAQFLAGLELEALCPCHCTDLAARAVLARRCPVREVGVGQRLEFS